jgi:hypothetical protein
MDLHARAAQGAFVVWIVINVPFCSPMMVVILLNIVPGPRIAICVLME